MRRISRPLAHRPGFTVVETLVALVLLVTGLLALASVSSLVALRVGSATRHALSNAAAGSLLDSLASVTCAAVGDGRDAVGPVEREWDAGGAGRSRRVRLLARTTAGRGATRTESFESALPCEAP